MKDLDNVELTKIFSSYLKTVVKNARFDYLSRMKRSQREEALDEQLHDLPYDAFDVDKLLLRTALKEQPLIRQQILYYSYHCGFSSIEISKLLQCSVGYVNRQKRAALLALRKKMEGGKEDS